MTTSSPTAPAARTARTLGAASLLVALGLALSGCTAGGSGDAGSSDAGGASSAGSAKSGSDAAAPADRQADGGVATATTSALRSRAVVRTGHLALSSRDPAAVLDRAHGLLERLGGTVDRERTTHDPAGRVTGSSLVLRVPVARFETLRRDLADLGRVRSSTESARDVTTEVIDTRERVRTLGTSLRRLQRFQRTASNARDLIDYEQQITERTAELQSLTAQRDYLTRQTSMSTLTVSVAATRPQHAEPGALDGAGFGSGLSGGWHALVTAGVLALTTLGAVLPFLPLLAVLGLGVWWLRRVRVHGGS